MDPYIQWLKDCREVLFESASHPFIATVSCIPAVHAGIR